MNLPALVAKFAQAVKSACEGLALMAPNGKISVEAFESQEKEALLEPQYLRLVWPEGRGIYRMTYTQPRNSAKLEKKEG